MTPPSDVTPCEHEADIAEARRVRAEAAAARAQLAAADEAWGGTVAISHRKDVFGEELQITFARKATK